VSVSNLSELTATRIRRIILSKLNAAKASHLGSALSLVEILLSIYSSVDISKIQMWEEDRDKIIVSKGHGAICLYAVLNHFGLLDDIVYTSILHFLRKKVLDAQKEQLK
jgi:transketolase